MKLNDIIKAFKEGKQAELPEELQFLLDPEFQKEVESLGSKEEKIRAAAQVMGQTADNVDEKKVGELVSAMKQTGLLDEGKGEGDEKEVNEDGEEITEEPGEEGEEAPEGSTEEGAPVEETASDEEGDPVEGGKEEMAPEGEEEESPVALPGEEERQANEAGVDLSEQEAATGAPTVGEAPTPNEQPVEGEMVDGEPVQTDDKLERVIRRALAAIEGLLRAD